MVDIRQDVCGILVGGSSAPGVNGVISAVVIQCIEWELIPIGFKRGFKYLKQGLSDHYITLKKADVTRVHNVGGSILATSKDQLVTDEDVSNCIDVLKHLKVRYLITIGGTETAFSAHKLASALRQQQFYTKLNIMTNNATISMNNGMEINDIANMVYSNEPNQSNNSLDNNEDEDDIDSDGIDPLQQRELVNQMISARMNEAFFDNSANNNNNSNVIMRRNDFDVNSQEILITHVPKTIFNDLPLPENCYTFGFSTARELGSKIVSNLSVDAKTMHRWYIVTVIGSRTGMNSFAFHYVCCLHFFLFVFFVVKAKNRRIVFLHVECFALVLVFFFKRLLQVL